MVENDSPFAKTVHYGIDNEILLQTLVDQGHCNYLAALQKVPQNMRNMYLHSFQSYLWNLAASHRVSTHGVDSPVVGDLVLPKGLDSGALSALT